MMETSDIFDVSVNVIDSKYLEWDYLPAVARLVRSRHIPFGPIVIAADAKGPDEVWMRSAEHNISLLRSSGVWPPDQLVFATWHVYPQHNLPETSPTAFAYLIDYYFDGK